MDVIYFIAAGSLWAAVAALAAACERMQGRNSQKGTA